MRTFFIILVLAATGLSKTTYVPDDQPTIQYAIYNSSPGDTVIVRPDSVNGGPYKENIDFVGLAITVRSEFGPSLTTIDALGVDSAAVFKTFETPDAKLEGFTLTNGRGIWTGTGFNGGGVFCYESSPTISDCIISGNTVDERGGGIFCEKCAPVIVNNTIVGNSSWAGSGIYCMQASPTIEGNYIHHNSNLHSGGAISCYLSAARIVNNILEENTACWGAGIMLTYSDALVSNNLITWNGSPIGYWSGGGGIYAECSSPVIINNTIAYNQVNHHGGGLCCGQESKVVALNNILWNNSGSYGSQIAVRDSNYPSHLIIDHSDVMGGHAQVYVEAGCTVDWGSHVIDADPQFYYGPLGAFYLGQDPCQPGLVNPCVDSGCNLAFNLCMDTCWTRTDEVIDTGVADMGFHYGPHVPPTLYATGFEISRSEGGTIELELNAGHENEFRNYIILGTVSGTTPGFALPGGFVLMPLNWDAFTDLCLDLVNTPVFDHFMGSLDVGGNALARLNAPKLPPSSIGVVMHFAGCLNNPFDFATNPVEIHIVP